MWAVTAKCEIANQIPATGLYAYEVGKGLVIFHALSEGHGVAEKYKQSRVPAVFVGGAIRKPSASKV